MKKNNKVKFKKQPIVDSDIHKEIRGFGVLLEHVDGRVGLIAEQYGEIKGEISDIKKTLNTHTEMIGNLAIDITIVKGDVAVLKTDLSVLKTDMTIVKKDVEIMKTDIEFIKTGLKKKVDIDEFAALERRVLLLEKHR